MYRFKSLGFKTVPSIPKRFANNLSHGSVSTRIQRRKLSSVSTDLFDKILIANRGEIACRVIKTAKKMGIKTVAVFSSADKDSMHVQMADEAYLIGPPPSKESYLRGDKIIEIAKRSGAKAIHPGYGFLSENAEFADLCEKNEITFIGPPSSAIRAMGSKSASKNIMSNASVPLIPGYHGEDQSMATLLREADKIGYPVLVKAVLGGGGKGMRIIERKEDFEEGLAAAKREAINSFNDDKILIEKYLTEPRHIEFQVFADKHGNVVYLHERDCSVQRRYQKVLEEAPAPNMSPDLRKKMGQAAVAAAKAVGYVGAGTVEFIVDANNPNQFYFMEMNTRLQVEHPITEMITKQDLVEWQIHVAANRRLPMKQDEIPLIGHAFEARIYAENPDNNFFPGTGRLIHLSTPNPSNHVRIDTGVRQGDEVSVFYDPMIAKLVVWDHDRKAALQRMLHALEQYQVIGLTTNITFLKRLVTHPQFILGKVGTFFINRYRDTLLPPPKPIPGYAVGLASLGVILNELTTQYPGSTLEVNSPFAANNARRLNMNHTRDIQFLDGENQISVSVQYNSDGTFGVKLPGSKDYVPAKGTMEGTELTASIGDELIKATVVVNDFTVHVFAHGQSFSLKIPVKDYSGASAVKGSLLSPMPGRITKVLVQTGDKVKKGAPLIIMEAMKMEHTIRSPVDGTVKKINYKVNDLVGEKQLLAAIEEDGK